MKVRCDKKLSTPTEIVVNGKMIESNFCGGECDEIAVYVDQQGYHHWYRCKKCGRTFERLR